MNLPGFYAQSSLRKASGTYCCLAHHGAAPWTSVALPQLDSASGCDVHCGHDADGNDACVVDCGAAGDPGVSFGGPKPSSRIQCVKNCLRRYRVGSKRTACIADCP